MLGVRGLYAWVSGIGLEGSMLGVRGLCLGVRCEVIIVQWLLRLTRVYFVINTCFTYAISCYFVVTMLLFIVMSYCNK